MIDIDSALFETEVLRASHAQPVVVDFWAPWCGPCRVLGPVLERLESKADGAWRLIKINTDQEPELAQRYGIQGIPAVKAFVDGEVVGEFVGARGEAEVSRWLHEVLPSAESRAAAAVLVEAEEAVERGELELARARLQAAGEHHPKRRQRLLRRIEALAAGDPEALRRAVQADPKDSEARHRLALALAARGQHEAAMEQLLELVARDRRWGDDQGRKTLLALFEELGPQHPLVGRTQRKLAMLLF